MVCSAIGRADGNSTGKNACNSACRFAWKIATHEKRAAKLANLNNLAKLARTSAD
jgi:hypothetical protein